MDDIGLGEFLVNFGYACFIVVFSIVFLVARFGIKVNTVNSLILSVFFGTIGYLAAPYLFSILLSLLGYSL